MSESVKKNIYLKISPVHGIFVANKSLDHKVTLQTQAEAVSFLLRDLNWKIPYVPQWVHTLTDTNLPSSTLRSQIWSISPAPDWTPPKMSEGKLIKALKQEFLLAMKVTFLLGLDAPSFYPWEWQCYFTMTGHVMGAVQCWIASWWQWLHSPIAALRVSTDTRPLLFTLSWGVWWSVMVTFQCAACGVTELPH